MNRVNFMFDNTSHYALYEMVSLDGVNEYLLELRDRSLINEFGLDIRFIRDANGHLKLPGTDSPRKKYLLTTILDAIDQQASAPPG